MSVDIAYIVSHGFAARMVMQTNLLGKLVEAGKSVAIISPDKKDYNLSVYCKEWNIPIYEFNEATKFNNQNYFFKRKYFLEDLHKNPALFEKHIYAIRYNRSLNPFMHIWPRYYWIIHSLIPSFPGIRRRFMEREKMYLFSSKAKLLIDAMAPNKLVATYPVNFNEAALLNAGNRRQGTETWIHLLSWDNITCKGHFAALADKYIVWGPIMREELKAYYNVLEPNIFVCGVPHFDLHVEISKGGISGIRPKLKFPPNFPYLFFAMSSPRFAPGEIDIVEWLANEVESGKFGPEIRLLVRPHPQNVTGHLSDITWLPRLRKLNERARVEVDFPRVTVSNVPWSMEMDDMKRLALLISGSVITLNSGSTVSIDALLHKKPVILTSFDGDREFSYWQSARRLIDYVHLKKLTSTGGIKIARSFADLERFILLFLDNPGFDLKKRQLALEKEIGVLDGTSTSQVAKLLISE